LLRISWDYLPTDYDFQSGIVLMPAFLVLRL
jgi:hypothetical protein